ncbi:hypothetical protein TorRG33x02_292060 [Trema orientale]|uniref:Uncharacterized protein n=1 Tax=Trema orientale TaxID=63057 RepID=A0A2P5CAM3_TREOI|nr:hypothetical protein TorRG33x02_292060 [Trema orientale]
MATLALLTSLLRNLRKKGCPFYEKLCIIFGDTTATGSNAHPSNRSPSRDMDDEKDEDDNAISKTANRNQENSLDGDSYKRSKSTISSNPRNGKRVKFSSVLACALETFNENTKRKTKILERSIKTELLERSITISSSHHLIDESVKALDEIKRISGEVYAKTIDKFENEVSRALFLKKKRLVIESKMKRLLNLSSGFQELDASISFDNSVDFRHIA